MQKQMTTKRKNEIMTVRVSDKGQITLPTLIQKMLGIKKGDKLVLYAENDEILLKKLNQIVAQMSDDFQDMKLATEKSLMKLWKDEPDDVWEKYL